MRTILYVYTTHARAEHGMRNFARKLKAPRMVVNVQNLTITAGDVQYKFMDITDGRALAGLRPETVILEEYQLVREAMMMLQNRED